MSIRVPPALRDELQREAHRHRRTLSREIQHRLAQSIPEKKRLFRESDQTYWLGLIVRELANSVEMDTGKSWRRDRYSFEAVKVALDIVFSEFAPAGDVLTPAPIKAQIEKGGTFYEPLRKPEGMASMIALGFIDQLKTTPALPVNIPPNVHYAEEFYWMPRARKALGLKPKGAALQREGNGD